MPHRKSFFVFLLCLSSLWVFSLMAATLFGAYSLTVAQVADVFTVFMQHGFSPSADVFQATGLNPTAFQVVTDIRLSRIVLALFVGGALALSGVVFQNVLRNPLADPYTLGVSGGAALGASLAIAGMFGVSSVALPVTAHAANSWTLAIQLLPFMAFCGAIFALVLALSMGFLVGDGFQRESIILAGVMVSTMLTALVALVKAFNEESVTSIVFWIMGSFQGKDFTHWALLLPWFALGLLCIIPCWRQLDVLALGDLQARQLGMNVTVIRVQLLFGASVMAAACVAVSGIIGFIGLVVPHLLRLLVGDRSYYLLPCAWFLGGILLLWADVLARSILSHGAELPVGVVTALLGVPIFCFLLVRQKHRRRSRV